MTLWIALRRLLPVLALAGLILSPLVATARETGATAVGVPAASEAAEPAGVSASVASVAAMPCCPDEQPQAPDCQKTCPLAALCFGTCTLVVVTAPGELLRDDHHLAVSFLDELVPDELSSSPRPRPPRA